MSIAEEIFFIVLAIVFLIFLFGHNIMPLIEQIFFVVLLAVVSLLFYLEVESSIKKYFFAVLTFLLFFMVVYVLGCYFSFKLPFCK